MLKGCHHLVVVEGKEGRRGREREKEKEGGREGGRTEGFERPTRKGRN